MNDKDKYFRLEEINISNIAKKVKAGKTLTASDRRAVENHRRREQGLRPQQTESETAKELGVTRDTIIRWKKMKAPFDGKDEELYQWMVNSNISGAKDWQRNFREANPGKFVKKATAKKKAKKAVTKTADELRDEYFTELQEARAAGDDSREKIALEYFLKIDKQIRDQEAHNKKLGLDSGETLPRKEVERLLRNWIHGGNACCDKYSKQIAQRLSGKKPAEVHKILKPMLTALLVFEGLKRMAKVPGDINLPQWFIDCVQDERKFYLKP
jgi:hypothetical protein